MYDIFISYQDLEEQSVDTTNAKALQKAFEERGYETFVNFDKLDDLYVESVIEEAPCFLVLLSDEYVKGCTDIKSAVYHEIMTAIKLSKFICSVSFDRTYSFSHPNNVPVEIDQTILGRQVPVIHKGAYYEKAIDSFIQNYIAQRVKKSHNNDSKFKSILEYVMSFFRNKEEDLLSKYIPQKTDYDIFISYRRIDGREYARNIQLALKGIGYKKIFFDYNSIQKGEFTKRIIDAIYSCNDFILVLSPKSMKRCGKQGDPVANEIRTAARYHKNIIPVTIDNNSVLWPRNFPDDLEFIKVVQRHDVKTDAYFENSIEELRPKLETKMENE